MMTEPSIEPFARAHLDGLIALVAAEGWTEYTEDVEQTYRALSGRGVTTLVALADERVVGAVQVQSDGVIQAHVSMLLIDGQWRGHQLGTRLLREGLERAGGLWLDIRTRTEGYYERLATQRIEHEAIETYSNGVRHVKIPDPDANAIAFAEPPDG